MSAITVTNVKFDDQQRREALRGFLDYNMRHGGTLAEYLARTNPEMSGDEITDFQAAIVEWVDYVDTKAPPMSFIEKETT